MKEPWQMTVDEYIAREKKKQIIHFEFDRQAVKEYLQRQVLRALAEGKRVPAKVLKQYPELVEQISDLSAIESEEPWQITRKEYEESGMADELGISYALYVRRMADEGKEVLPFGKQPYEMTRKEFREYTEAGYYGDVGKLTGKEILEGYDKYGLDAERRWVVQEALRKGKPVPAKVLKDYPDLAEAAGILLGGFSGIITKEPWQMTRQEWERLPEEMKAQFDIPGDPPYSYHSNFHLVRIIDALLKGKSVSIEVIESYGYDGIQAAVTQLGWAGKPIPPKLEKRYQEMLMKQWGLDGLSYH